MKKILIIGGGYGGLKAAITLQKRHAKAHITLVSKHHYHYQTTLLHKVAIGTLTEEKAKIFYRQILNTVHFTKDKIMEILPQENRAIGKYATYDYDILVIALGFKPNFFGIPGAREHTFRLTSLNAALRLHKHIEWRFKDFHIAKDPKDLSFIVCGTGLTSIEFAAELACNVQKICKIYGVDKNLVKITCIGRSERILPVFPESLSALATKKLQDLNVIFLNATVSECCADGVIIKDATSSKKIEGHTILWGAGVKGNDTIEHYSQMKSIAGKISVDARLKSTDFENVYVVGDCATSERKGIEFVPTAQLATQMGQYVGDLLADELEGKKTLKDFVFVNRGSVCSLGHDDAIGVVFGKKISGFCATFMKNLIENRWLFGIGGLKLVLKKGQSRFRK